MLNRKASKAHVELCRLAGFYVGVGDPIGMHAAQAVVSGSGIVGSRNQLRQHVYEKKGQQNERKNI